MVPALACIKWFDCHLPGAVVSQGTSRPNAENCSAFPLPTRQSASIEAVLLGLTSIYIEFIEKRSEGKMTPEVCVISLHEIYCETKV